MAKIQRNDPCPCGSGKKYKFCCGSNIRLFNENYVKSDLQVADFVLDRVSEDIAFLQDAIQLILGPYGYSYCNKNQKELEEEYQKDGLKSYVRSDVMGVTFKAANSETIDKVWNVSPYIGAVPPEVEDIMSLLEKGHVCVEGRQVELFHAYLLDRLSARFKDYLYVPSKEVMKEQKFGAFAHRGYDFLLGITLYLELQLGIHVYLYKMNSETLLAKDKKSCIDYFKIMQIPENKEMLPFLSGYKEVIKKQISSEYNSAKEVELYRSIGAYETEEYDEYQDRKTLTAFGDVKGNEQGFDYISYLRFLVSAICFNHPGLFSWAGQSFPQCDLVKYLFGLEAVVELFKEENKQQNPIESEYHTAVFYMMDERFGMSTAIRPPSLKYVDFPPFEEDEYFSKEGHFHNPARKTIRRKPVKKMVMNLYNNLNGHFFALELGDDCKGWKIVGKYPILPWISSGEEHTVHCDPFDGQEKKYADLYSDDIKRRQYFLDIEYRLTEIPVNCVEEFLNPDVFYKWRERNKLLKETQEQNEELKVLNDNLNRHMQLNQELVRSLSHASANYMNSDRLARIGMELHEAKQDDPAVDELHMKGLSLLLQSEQEMYLSRQLDSLVWRCSGDVDFLSRQIRGSLSKDDGVTILAPIEFAVKTVLARVLFREGDRRSEFIRDKIVKTVDEWTQIKSSFMLDILANNNSSDGVVIDWWREHIGVMEIPDLSEKWKSVKLIKDEAFYDLITEITTEQIINFLSHGDVTKGVCLEFGQDEGFRGRPKWAFVLCRNTLGNQYTGGKGVGVSTLDETMRLLNNNKRGIETNEEDGLYESRVWIEANLLKPL